MSKIEVHSDPIEEQLQELCLLTAAYISRKDRGLPAPILRRALLEAIEEIATAHCESRNAKVGAHIAQVMQSVPRPGFYEPISHETKPSR